MPTMRFFLKKKIPTFIKINGRLKKECTKPGPNEHGAHAAMLKVFVSFCVKFLKEFHLETSEDKDYLFIISI